MMHRSTVLLALASCGRIYFDPRSDADPGSDAQRDAAGPQTDIHFGSNTGNRQVTMRDTVLDECLPMSNRGAATHFHIKDSAGCPDGAMVGLLRFDLSEISPSAQVTAAALRVWTHTSNPVASQHTVHRVLESWEEGNGDDSATMLGAANWIDRAPGVGWTAPGCGDGSCDPAVIGSFVAVIGPDVLLETPLDLAVVQGWVDGTYENAGIAIKTAGSTIASQLGTREDFDGLRPELVLSYVP